MAGTAAAAPDQDGRGISHPTSASPDEVLNRYFELFTRGVPEESTKSCSLPVTAGRPQVNVAALNRSWSRAGIYFAFTRYTRSPSLRETESIRSPIFFFNAPLRKPRTERACHPVTFLSSASDAPAGLRSSARILAVLDLLRALLGLLFRRDLPAMADRRLKELRCCQMRFSEKLGFENKEFRTRHLPPHV
jgi:hypothetical protein